MLAFSLRDTREGNRFTTSQLKLRVVNRCPAACCGVVHSLSVTIWVLQSHLCNNYTFCDMVMPLRYALIKLSIPPSITACMLPVSSLVR